MADKVLAAELDIAIDKYLRKMRQAENAAKGVDDALDDTTKEARKAGKALSDIKDVNVKIEADTRAINQAEGDVRAIGSMRVSPTVKPDVDDAEVTSLLDRLKAPILVTVTAVSAGAAVGGLLLNEAGQERAGESAFALTTGRTREEVAGIGDTINQVWLTGLAESRAEIGQVAGAFSNAGATADEIAAATEAAFIIAAQSGEDVKEVVRAQIALVKNGLSPSFADAGNAISVGFGEGLNRGNDFLDTITEYSTVFADLDTDAEGFFAILKGGLEGGALNTDKVADAFNEVRIRIQTALSAGEGTEFDALQELGLLDEARAFEAGTLTGENFLAALLGAVEGGDYESLVGVFGTPIEDLGTSVFEAIDGAFGDPALVETFRGTTETASSVLEDNIGFAMERARRVIIDDLTEGFTVGGQPLTALLDSIPEKLNEFSDLVASGAGIPEALSIVLEAPELAGQLRELQATIGGFILDFQLMLAGVADIFGQDEAATGLRTGVAEGAAAQLEFDLVFSEGDVNEVVTAYNNAIRRGVETEDIAEAFNTATLTIAEDFGIEAAREFNDAVASLGNIGGDVAGANAAEFGASTAFEFFETTGFDQAVSALVEPALSGAWNEAVQNVLAAPVGEVQQAAVTELTNAFNDMLAQVDPTVQPVTFAELVGIADSMAIQSQFDGVLGTQAVFLDDVVEGYRTAQGDIEGTLTAVADTATTEAVRTADALDPILIKIEEVNQAIFDAATSLNNLYLAAGVQPPNYTPTIPIDGERAAGGPVNAGGRYLVGEMGPELFIPSTSGTIIPNGPTMAAMGGNTYNVSTVYNVDMRLNAGNMAQANAAGGRFANQLRGYN